MGALSIRLHPTQWHNAISWAFDIIGLIDLYEDHIGVVKGSDEVGSSVETSSNADPNVWKDYQIYSRNGWKAAVND